MFAALSPSKYIMIAMAVVIAILSASLYFAGSRIESLNKALGIEAGKVTQLIGNIESQKKVIQAYVDQRLADQQALDALGKASSEANARADEIAAEYASYRGRLSNAALKRTSLIEKMSNRATQKVYADMERATTHEQP